jgi:hypothetical protein
VSCQSQERTIWRLLAAGSQPVRAVRAIRVLNCLRTSAFAGCPEATHAGRSRVAQRSHGTANRTITLWNLEPDVEPEEEPDVAASAGCKRVQPAEKIPKAKD